MMRAETEHRSLQGCWGGSERIGEWAEEERVWYRRFRKGLAQQAGG